MIKMKSAIEKQQQEKSIRGKKRENQLVCLLLSPAFRCATKLA